MYGGDVLHSFQNWNGEKIAVGKNDHTLYNKMRRNEVME